MGQFQEVKYVIESLKKKGGDMTEKKLKSNGWIFFSEFNKKYKP